MCIRDRIKRLYDLGVEIEENSELDLFEAFNKHANDPRIPDVVKDCLLYTSEIFVNILTFFLPVHTDGSSSFFRGNCYG